MRNLLSILRIRLLLTGLLLVMAFLVMPVTAQAAGFSGSGSGTAADPYVITTPEQLNEVRNNLSAHYRLGADIDLSGYMSWQPIGSQSAPFTGSLDGGGFTIRNLSIDRSNDDIIGLFGSVNGASFQNVIIKNGLVRGRYETGGLAGRASNASINGCSFSGSVFGYHTVGGLVGKSDGSNIQDSWASGYVTGDGFCIGGLIGACTINGGTIRNSHAQSQVTGGADAGGLIGDAQDNVNIINCYAVASTKPHPALKVQGIIIATESRRTG